MQENQAHEVSSTRKELNDLLAQRRAVDEKIEALQKSAKADVIKQIRSLVDEYALEPNEIFGQNRSKMTTGKPVEAKYRDPETGLTWTGRGKAPLWIKDKDRADFEIRS